jgi:hypothetical protein
VRPVPNKPSERHPAIRFAAFPPVPMHHRQGKALEVFNELFVEPEIATDIA